MKIDAPKKHARKRLPKIMRDPMKVLARGQKIHGDIIEQRLVLAIKEADANFITASATATKTYVRYFLIPALASQGITLDTDV